MKVVLGLTAIIVLLLVVAYQFGGFSMPDPVEQAKQFKQTVKPGMTWEQVVDVKTPRKLTPLDPNTFNGRRQDMDFNADELRRNLANNTYPYGFVMPYQFTDSDAYEVYFDSQGKVETVADVMTVRDLYEGKAFMR